MKSNMFKMVLGMSACCLIPILIAFIIPIFGISSSNSIIAAITPFLCPIIMVCMMLFMGMGKNGHSSKGHSCCSAGDKEKESEIVKQ